MTIVELSNLITKYNLEEHGKFLYYQNYSIGAYGVWQAGAYISFDSGIDVANPIACDNKIQKMIKEFKEKTIKIKLNELNEDFENGT